MLPSRPCVDTNGSGNSIKTPPQLLDPWHTETKRHNPANFACCLKQCHVKALPTNSDRRTKTGCTASDHLKIGLLSPCCQADPR